MRYLAYLGYGLASGLFFIGANILGIVFFDSPVCVRTAEGCTGVDWWRPYHGDIAMAVAVTVPLLAFFPFRRWVARITGDQFHKRHKP